MAPSESARAALEPLGEDDLDDALALSAEAGWNQTAADWTLMLRLGHAFAVRDEGRVVATALALPYAARLRLGEHGARARAVPAARPRDAARGARDGRADRRRARAGARRDAGRRGGLRAGWASGRSERLMRWRGAGRRRRRGAARRAGARRGAAGARPRGLRRRPRRDPRRPRRAPGARGRRRPGRRGYLLSRAGRTATQLGPARGPRRGDRGARCCGRPRRVAGTAVVDVPERATAVAGLLAGRGFAPERPFVRMALGRDEIAGEPALVHAIAGPELG